MSGRLVPSKSPSTMVKLLLIVFGACLVSYAKCSEPPTTVECVSEQIDVWEFRPYPANCNLYIICMNGVGIVLQCPDELYFDPETELCDLPENVDCVPVTDSPPETEEPPTEEPPTPPPTEEPGCNDRCVLQSSVWGGEVSDANDCSRFVNCMDNCRGATLTCPEGLYFNHLLSVCDLPERSECLLEVCVDQPIGLLASVNSCKHFFLCQASTARVFSCTPNEIFYPVHGCLPGDPSQCEHPLQSQNIPDAPKDVQEKCDSKSSKFIRHPERCDVFYRCAKSQLFGRMCQQGLLFDETVGLCNLAEKVDCVEL